MALSERIAEMSTQSGRRCLAMQIYAKLSPDDQQAFDSMVDMLRETRISGVFPRHTEISGSSLARALQQEGYEISVDTMQAHIYQRCGCRDASV